MTRASHTPEGAGGRTRRLLVLVAAATLCLDGCASIQETFGGWFGPESESSETSAAAAQSAQTFFAATGGLAVHGDPTGASNVVGRLALHEKVTRTQLERGYAYVTSATSGISGWVDNAQLIWRLPVPGAPAAAPSAPPDTAPADDVPVVPPSPVPTATAEPAAPPPTAVPTVQAPASKPAPEMFDPY